MIVNQEAKTVTFRKDTPEAKGEVEIHEEPYGIAIRLPEIGREAVVRLDLYPCTEAGGNRPP